jgi:hypothetical protein
MCPACIATAALIAGSAVSTGGLTAMVFTKFKAKKFERKKFSAKNLGEKICTQTQGKENHDGHQQN